MKFLTLEDGQLGALLDETVVDVLAASRELSSGSDSARWRHLCMPGTRRRQRSGSWHNRRWQQASPVGPIAEVRPLAPIPVPRRNILCLGKNYLDHAQEIAAKMQQSARHRSEPIIFTKATTAVIAPGAPIPAYPAYTRKLDYEAELALVIGKGGRDITAEHAWEHVFGYTAINDISARDLQKDHHQWFRAKSLDGFAPMGPVLVHRSVMPAPEAISVRCFVNGEQRQGSTFDQPDFRCPDNHFRAVCRHDPVAR